MKHISKINPTIGLLKHVRDRIDAEVAKLDAMSLEPTNTIEMRAGARAANIRVAEDRNSTKWKNNPRAAKAVVLSRGSEVREFSSTVRASKALGLNVDSLYTCLARGKSLNGWQVRYADDKVGAA